MPTLYGRQAMVQLQFVGAKGLSSDLIKMFGHGLHVSHVDAVMPDQWLLGARYDNIGGGKGVRIRPPGYEQWEYIKRVSFPCTQEQEVLFYDFLKAQVGKPYDWSAIVAFAVNRDWRNPDAWFCSELQGAALETARLMKRLVLPTNKLDPGSLLLASSALVTV